MQRKVGKGRRPKDYARDLVQGLCNWVAQKPGDPVMFSLSDIGAGPGSDGQLAKAGIVGFLVLYGYVQELGHLSTKGQKGKNQYYYAISRKAISRLVKELQESIGVT